MWYNRLVPYFFSDTWKAVDLSHGQGTFKKEVLQSGSMAQNMRIRSNLFFKKAAKLLLCYIIFINILPRHLPVD